MKCSNCGIDLPSNAKFCVSCGTKVNLKKTCSYCGAELPANAKFCISCGNSTTVENNKTQETANNTQKHDSKDNRDMYVSLTLFGEKFKFPIEEYGMRKYVKYYTDNIVSNLENVHSSIGNLQDFLDMYIGAIEYEYSNYLRQDIPMINKMGIQMNEMQLLNSVLGDLNGAKTYFSYISSVYNEITHEKIRKEMFPSFTRLSIGRLDKETKNIINTMVRYKKPTFANHIVNEKLDMMDYIVEKSVDYKVSCLYDVAKFNLYEYIYNDILLLTLYVWLKYLHRDYTEYVYTIERINKSNMVAANWTGNYKKMPRREIIALIQYTAMGEEKWIKEIATALSDEDTDNLKKFLELLQYDDIAKLLSGVNSLAKMYGGKLNIEKIEKRMGKANNVYYDYIKPYIGQKPFEDLCAMMFNAARHLEVKSEDQNRRYKKFLKFGVDKAREIITPTSLDKYGQVRGDHQFNDFWDKISTMIVGVEKDEKPIFIYIDLSCKFFIVTTHALYIPNMRAVINGLDEPACTIHCDRKNMMDEYDNLIEFHIGDNNDSKVTLEMNDGDYDTVDCLKDILNVIMFLAPWYLGKREINLEQEPINNPFYNEVLKETGARKTKDTRNLLYGLGKKLSGSISSWNLVLEDPYDSRSSMKKGEFAINRMNSNKKYGEDEKILFLLGDFGLFSSTIWAVVSDKAVYLNEKNKIYPFNIIKEFGYKSINDNSAGLFINGELIGDRRIGEDSIKALNLYIQAMAYIFCGKRINSFI